MNDPLSLASDKVVFTICSNNYIYKARVLAASVRRLTQASVFLFLADAPAGNIDYEAIGFDRVFFPDELGIPNLEWMKANYSVVEFNTAIKPFAFRYLLDHTPANQVYFFDPDIKLYQALNSFDSFWENSFMLLTPHILSPLPQDGKFPSENLFCNHGIYNLGFLALSRCLMTDSFLDWWSERLLDKCIIDLREGYYVDQLPMNLAPLFFQPTTVISHPGCNMSYWNLHERKLEQIDGTFLINGTEKLIFYHFSSFDPELRVIHHYPGLRYSFEDMPVLKNLYADYLKDINSFNPAAYAAYHYFDGKFPVTESQPNLFRRAYLKIKRQFVHG